MKRVKNANARKARKKQRKGKGGHSKKLNQCTIYDGEGLLGISIESVKAHSSTSSQTPIIVIDDHNTKLSSNKTASIIAASFVAQIATGAVLTKAMVAASNAGDFDPLKMVGLGAIFSFASLYTIPVKHTDLDEDMKAIPATDFNRKMKRSLVYSAFAFATLGMSYGLTSNSKDADNGDQQVKHIELVPAQTAQNQNNAMPAENFMVRLEK